jgi:hypothetical protein
MHKGFNRLHHCVWFHISSVISENLTQSPTYHSQFQLLYPHPRRGALEPGNVEVQLIVHRILDEAGPHLCSLLQNEPGVHAASAPDSYTLERFKFTCVHANQQACDVVFRSTCRLHRRAPQCSGARRCKPHHPLVLQPLLQESSKRLCPKLLALDVSDEGVARHLHPHTPHEEPSFCT